MNWRVKLLAQRLLDFPPPRVAVPLHNRLQKRFGNVESWDASSLLSSVGAKTFRTLHNLTSLSFEGAKVLELGTGWHGGDALILFLLGCSEIVTCDVMAHLRPDLVIRNVDLLGTHLRTLSEVTGQNESRIAESFLRLRSAKSGHEVLKAANIRYVAPVVFSELAAPNHYFDLFYSRSVLQRVPEVDLRNYLARGLLALRPGGISFHVIHHSDHNARHDPDLPPLNYLKYSQRVYDAVQSKRFNYQSRLRHCEFVDLFRETGYEFLAEEAELIGPEALNNVKLHKHFRAIPEEDIRIVKTELACRRPYDGNTRLP